MLTKESASRLSRCLVACNIYVSAGQVRCAPFLFQLLLEAQQECVRLRRSSSSSSLAVVHAYADGPYDRSSFHVAGSPTLVASLASHIAASAASTLQQTRRDPEGTLITAHPTVGLVDHVSVLPLSQKKVDEKIPLVSLEEWTRTLEMDCPKGIIPQRDKMYHSASSLNLAATLPSGWVARTVGHALEQVGVQVFWYGHADPHETPLAKVRKDKTEFFKSLPSSPSTMGQATVGAPPYFVENYNIQVATHDKRMAQSLTKWVRSRDGGLPFVEALTLSYGTIPGRCVEDDPIPVYEVACNLLNPTVTSTKDIDVRVQTWIMANHDVKDASIAMVQSSYRVGTTVDMCLSALYETSTPEGEQEYNQRIRNALEGYLKDR